jgi:tetratricopeptide (TPR) repeat protein
MKRSILLCACAMLIALPVSAAPLTLTRDYSYRAGDADSKLTSRSIALEQVKRLLLEELGTYLVSNTIVKDAQLSKDEIVTYTAGAVVTVIIEETWDGATYYLKARLTADPDDVARSLTAIRNDQERAAELDQIRRQANDSLKEIERLKKELAEAKKTDSAGTTHDRSLELRKRYDVKTGELAAKEYLDQGLSFRNENKFDRAVTAFSRAIELAPQWDRPYAGRGAAYVRMNDNARGEADLERAKTLAPENMIAVSLHGVSLIRQGKKRDGMAEVRMAVEKAPENIVTNTSMGWALLEMNQARASIPFLTKAIELSQKKHGRAYLFRAKAFRQLGEHAKAKADLDRARVLGEVPPNRDGHPGSPRRVLP